MRRAAPLVLPLALAATTGCSSYLSGGAGPAIVVAPEQEGRATGAAAVEGAFGGGQSNAAGTRTWFVDMRGRLLVAEPHQQFIVLFGATDVRWVGRKIPLSYGGGLGFGGDWIPGEPSSTSRAGNGFFDLVAQARLGTGFAVAERVTMLPAWEVGGVQSPAKVWRRTRYVLTLGVVGDVNARMTREPMYSTSLLVGFAVFDEWLR